ncbi:MAG TPA: NAD(P)-binding protein, partial [Bacteroidales bacterium]
MANNVIIIGAGPAGLTAAYELLTKTDLVPIIFEKTSEIGGISKTVNYKGNRIDIGGHRFFSKSTIVMEWWGKFFPYEDKSKDESNPEKSHNVLLIRNRLSRILYLRKFFDYPITLSKNTLVNLGFARVIKIMLSYLRSVLFKQKPEKTLEDFLINRFGKELYNTFFKSYTEKVWGVPCNNISKEWGTQRIKGLSVTKTLVHAVKNIISKNKSVDQKEVETSLIAQFLYPKYGPGQFWEFIASEIEKMGGKIYMNHEFVEFEKSGNQIVTCMARNTINNELIKLSADYFFSTMPVSELMAGLDAPQNVKEIAAGLVYRDFITVGLLLKDFKKENGKTLKDNWIYIQEKDVNVGRIQLFNNW